jgi:hypothetical protein
MKRKIEKDIENEIKTFIDNYFSEFSDIMENYKALIKYINMNELESLNKYNNLFSI